MNYRHGYHAGNFADVLKHVVLCRILVHLRQKPTPFRVIDTHAGGGRYDLRGPEASRSGEWRTGIGRLWGRAFAANLGDLLGPYLEIVAAFNPGGTLATYPGSPLVARALLRPQDRLIACEIEPNAAAALEAVLHGDRRSKAVRVDGWTALAAYVPPVERRGLVLIDPPFEQPDEFSRLADGLCTAHRKWPTGIYLLWYPIKDRRDASALERHVRECAVPRVLRVELALASPSPDRPLAATGLLIVNPPWTLPDELTLILDGLKEALAEGGEGRFRLDWLTTEN